MAFSSKSEDSKTWFIGKHYSHSHVLLPLINARRLITIAQFGTEDISNEMDTPQHVKDKLRVNAIKRLYMEISQLLDDVQFLMGKVRETAKPRPGTALLFVTEVREALNHVNVNDTYKMKTDVTTGLDHMEVKEEEFSKALNQLRKLLSDLKFPLNMRNLIFPASDDFDIDEIRREIVESG